MRGRARCYIIAFFALAFLGQLAVVFIYFPSSSMGSAPLLDESVFPASPAVRLATKTSNQMRSGSITTSIGTRQQVQSTPTAPLPPSMPLANPGPVQQPSFPSTDVVTAAPMQPELVSSNRGPQYDLVTSHHRITCRSNYQYHHFPHAIASMRACIARSCCIAGHRNQHRRSHRKPRLSPAHFKGVARECASVTHANVTIIEFLDCHYGIP